MALSEEKKAYLDQLRRDLIKRTGPDADELDRVTNELDLTGISAEDLESLCIPQFEQICPPEAFGVFCSVFPISLSPLLSQK